MREASFIKIEQLLPFLLSSFSALFIAAQIAMIVFCKYVYSKDSKLVLRELKKFFIANILLFFCLMIFGVILWEQKNIVFYDPMKESIIATKIAVCLLIALNFSYMYYKFFRAKKAFLQNEQMEIDENIAIIAYHFTPLNIVLSILNIYLGVALRDF